MQSGIKHQYKFTIPRKHFRYHFEFGIRKLMIVSISLEMERMFFRLFRWSRNFTSNWLKWHPDKLMPTLYSSSWWQTISRWWLWSTKAVINEATKEIKAMKFSVDEALASLGGVLEAKCSNYCSFRYVFGWPWNLVRGSSPVDTGEYYIDVKGKIVVLNVRNGYRARAWKSPCGCHSPQSFSRR